MRKEMPEEIEKIADKIAEHSGGARAQSYAAGWGTGKDYIGEKGYCVRLNQVTPADKYCTGFYWVDDEYTPVIGCITCKYWRRGD